MVRTKTISPNTKSIAELRELVDTPKMIGSSEELVPFAWRLPLSLKLVKQPSRVLKTMALEATERNKKI